MHRRAFNSYKKFEFLKAGILTKDEEKRIEKDGKAKKYDLYEPFNYPPLKDSVAHILSDGNQMKVLDAGEPIRTPGRKFGYSERDFLDAYLGKDYARAIDLGDNEYN
jgi:hypothetical protein